VLADEAGRSALHCIRCSACLNVCPVYERTGGHAYGSVYPGPIGAVLSPQLTGVEDNASLPYASSLCGACFDACPVKIDIPSILVHLRNRAPHPRSERAAMAAAAYTMDHRGLYERAQRAAKLARIAGRRGRGLPPPLNGWTAGRDLPVVPEQTFRDWWRSR
jgi:L-lactate dehydrogenase complex protein LldF